MDNIIPFKPRNNNVPDAPETSSTTLYEKVIEVLTSQYGNLFAASLLSDNSDVHAVFPLGFDDEVAQLWFTRIVEMNRSGRRVDVPIVLIFNDQVDNVEIKDKFLAHFEYTKDLVIDLMDSRSFKYMANFSKMVEILTDLARDLGQPMPSLTWFKYEQGAYRVLVKYQDFSIIQLFPGVEDVPAIK